MATIRLVHGRQISEISQIKCLFFKGNIHHEGHEDHEEKKAEKTVSGFDCLEFGMGREFETVKAWKRYRTRMAVA